MTREPRNLLQIISDGRREAPDLEIVTFVSIDRSTDPSGTIVGEARTYDQLWRKGSAFADGLEAEGMGDQDAFALIMHNHPEFVEAMVGSCLAGTVYVPIDPRLAAEKIAYMVRFSGCRGAVVADYALDHVLSILDQTPDLEWIWVIGGGAAPEKDVPVRISNYHQYAERDSDRAMRELDPLKPMQMLFTSGTTGDPKAIISTHGRFIYASSLAEQLGLMENERPYTGLPLSHANAQLLTLANALAMQTPVVISQRFTKTKLWEILTLYGCTTFNLLGGMVIAIAAEPPGPFDRAHKVRFVLSAGMPASLWENFSDRFGVEIFEFFGAAEGGLTLNPPGTGPVGSIGKAPEGTVCAVLDENDQEVRPHEMGQLCFRNADGTVSPVAYFNNEEASEAKTAGGWFRSGDMGWKDEDGWVYFGHRAGSAIRRNGEFVAAGDVEAAVAEHEAVDDVHVYGVHTRANAPGEREIIAAVVPKRAEIDTVSIFRHCQGKLGKNATPAYIQIITEIPKTASEKPQERFLRSMLKTKQGRLVAGEGVPELEIGD